MSYCRFSSDGYQCDLFAYRGERGFIIHIAEKRYNNAAPLVQDYLRLKKNGKGWNKRSIKSFNVATKNWKKAQSKLSEEECFTKINLPFAGETLLFDDIEDFRDKMYELMEMGYQCDWGVIAIINEEINPTPRGILH